MTEPDPITRLTERRRRMLGDLERLRRQAEETGSGILEQKALNLARDVDRLDAALVQANLTHAIEAETDAREATKAEQENTAFWYRRFMLSLQIGNGTGFLATLTAFSQADQTALATAAKFALWPAYSFGIGVVAAGLLPLLAAFERRRDYSPRARRAMNGSIYFLTFLAAMGFVAGVQTTWQQLYEITKQPAVTHAADPAPPSPSPAPPPPVGGPSGSPGG